jgi:hypothetical protein
LSVEPFQGITKFEQLPYLEKDTSRNILAVMIGIFLAVGPLLFEFSRSRYVGCMPDPWTLKVCTQGLDVPYVCALVTLFILTYIIAWKQYGYYYGKRKETQPTGKDRIFSDNIRQVNERESTADIWLAIVGSALFAFVFFPVFWFLLFGIYSLIVVWRSLTTLLRKAFSKKDSHSWMGLKDVIFPSKTADGELEVKYVLGGWIVTMSVTALCSFVGFAVLIELFALGVNTVVLMAAFITVAAGVGVAFVVLGMFTYDWAKTEGACRVFRWYERNFVLPKKK